MYMRNRKYDNYALNSFPPNYSGQYSPEEIQHEDLDNIGRNDTTRRSPHDKIPEPAEPKIIEEKKERKEEKEEKKSFLGSIFGGKDGEKKGGLLSGLFNKDKDGGFLSGIEMEDLILLAVIFFLLKDGFEDDLIIILALILIAG